MNKQKVVLITGASSGIGRACAQFLYEKGHRVYGTSRKAQKADTENQEAAKGPILKMLPMDVNDSASVSWAVQYILDMESRIDVLVNCAGFGIAGAVEDTCLQEAKAQFETNFFGVLRLCHAVLPVMRKQGSGCIINISSIAGIIGIPFQGMYSASKFALEGMTEALRAEVRQFGIKVVLIEPGDFCTGFTANRIKTALSLENSAYAESFHRSLKVMEEDEMKGASPIKVARLVHRIIEKSSPSPRYVVGPFFEKVAVALKKILPQKVFEWAILKYYKVR